MPGDLSLVIASRGSGFRLQSLRSDPRTGQSGSGRLEGDGTGGTGSSRLSSGSGRRPRLRHLEGDDAAKRPCGVPVGNFHEADVGLARNLAAARRPGGNSNLHGLAGRQPSSPKAPSWIRHATHIVGVDV